MTAAGKFRRLLAADERYSVEAYNFVYEALDWTLNHVVQNESRESQHVTGVELLEGVKQYAVDQFGCLARTVLESWGVTRTNDFGELVFNLVEHDLMGRQDSDSLDDFDDVYLFGEVFDLDLRLCYRAERDEWETDYVERVNSKTDAR
tara:strand:+ start:42 stop:485 length:444 start_codon:yes stop_codon:yes gene_type:complete